MGGNIETNHALYTVQVEINTNPMDNPKKNQFTGKTKNQKETNNNNNKKYNKNNVDPVLLF